MKPQGSQDAKSKAKVYRRSRKLGMKLFLDERTAALRQKHPEQSVADLLLISKTDWAQLDDETRASYIRKARSQLTGQEPSLPLRPKSAFLYFLQDFRASKSAAASGNGQTRVCSAAGVEWRGLNDAERAPYLRLATQAKHDYAKQQKQQKERVDKKDAFESDDDLATTAPTVSDAGDQIQTEITTDALTADPKHADVDEALPLPSPSPLLQASHLDTTPFFPFSAYSRSLEQHMEHTPAIAPRRPAPPLCDTPAACQVSTLPALARSDSSVLAWMLYGILPDQNHNTAPATQAVMMQDAVVPRSKPLPAASAAAAGFDISSDNFMNMSPQAVAPNLVLSVASMESFEDPGLTMEPFPCSLLDNFLNEEDLALYFNSADVGPHDDTYKAFDEFIAS